MLANMLISAVVTPVHTVATTNHLVENTPF
jgi:hypothetical protein